MLLVNKKKAIFLGRTETSVFICCIVMALLTLWLSLLTISPLLLFPPFIQAVKPNSVLLGGLEGIPELRLTETEVCVYLL